MDSPPRPPTWIAKLSYRSENCGLSSRIGKFVQTPYGRHVKVQKHKCKNENNVIEVGPKKYMSIIYCTNGNIIRPHKIKTKIPESRYDTKYVKQI